MKHLLTVITIGFFLFVECSNLTPENAYKKGTEFAKAGNTKKAYDQFKTAIAKDPENSNYHIAAGSTAPDQNAAFLHFKSAWEKGLKTKTLLFTLLKLSFHVDKEEKVSYGLSLYEQLPDSLKSITFKGELFFQFAMYDSAIALWKSQQSIAPSAEVCNNISLAYANNKQIDSALSSLLNCKQNGVVNSNSFIQLASLYSLKLDYASIENMFKEIENGVYYTNLMKLEHAAFLLIHDRLDEAVGILVRAGSAIPDDQKALIENRMRSMRAYIAVMKNQPQSIDTILTQISSSAPNGQNEIDLMKAIQSVMKNDSLSLKSLEAARMKNPYNPLIDLLCARKNTTNKNYEMALNYYTSLPAILQWSPRIVTEIATTLIYAGKEDDAMRRISLLHKHGIYTKQSLEIFRDVAFKKNLLEKSATAQQLLEKRYGNDVNIKWHGLLLAIKEGNIESAEATVQELLQNAPNDERFIIANISILFMKKDYSKIISELPKSGLPIEKVKPLEAMAWLKSGDTSKAITALEIGIEKSHDFQMMTELAELFLNSNQPDKAAAIYKQIIDRTSSEPIDSLKTASTLNNYAWVLSSSEHGDLITALGAAKKAYDLAPDNFHILDTYASILLKGEKFRECIKLLDSNEKIKTQARLLCHLAEAYEKAGNLNKARRYYEDAINMEASDQLPLTKSKESIKQHIKELLSRES